MTELIKYEAAGAPEQKYERERRDLPDGLTWDRVISAVDLVLEWESGQFRSDMATDLVIALYPILRG